MCVSGSKVRREGHHPRVGVQGRTRMTRAAFYLPAPNQEGEEVPAENSDMEKSQPRANNNNSNIPSRKHGT